VQVAEFAAEAMDGNEGKLAEKIAALAGCAAVYCLAVGGSAVRQLLAAGVQPMRLDDAVAIDALLAQLRAAIRDGGIPWIDNAARRGPPHTGGEAEPQKPIARDGATSRFDRMAEEGWQE